ncbi:MAG: HalOD1 output domain-containing protein [Haloarculaceae archaeon]
MRRTRERGRSGATDATRARDVTYEVVSAIAAVEGTTQTELGYSLHEHVDAEVIAALVEMGRGEWELTFRVPDHEVAVGADGEVLVDGRIAGHLEMPDT